MKVRLLQDLLDLNRAFEQVLRGLKRMERIPLFHREELRYASAQIETARVQTNREFFDKFDQIVEQDALWAYRFRRAYDQKTRDPFDLYLEVKEREEVRKKKGLPPRVVLLPDWDKDDEELHDEEQAKKRKRASSERGKKLRKHRPNPDKPPSPFQTDVGRRPKGRTG